MADPRFIQAGFEKTLAHFIEEAGETLAAAGKTQRWGPMSVNPLVAPEQQETNADWLWRELDDLEGTINRLRHYMMKEGLVACTHIAAVDISDITKARASLSPVTQEEK